ECQLVPGCLLAASHAENSRHGKEHGFEPLRDLLELPGIITLEVNDEHGLSARLLDAVLVAEENPDPGAPRKLLLDSFLEFLRGVRRIDGIVEPPLDASMPGAEEDEIALETVVALSRFHDALDLGEVLCHVVES